MVDGSELFIGLDVSKDSHAVAVAESGRDGEVRIFGEIGCGVGAQAREEAGASGLPAPLLLRGGVC